MAKSIAVAKGYRSGFEDRIAMELADNGVFVPYEDVTLEYIAMPKRYTPDFVLPNGIVIETKGYFIPEDRTKHILIKKQYPELDLRFVFQNAGARLSKTSKTNYAKWATNHGFKWAMKHVPVEWLKEPMNEKSMNLIKQFKAAMAEKGRRKKDKDA